MAKRKLLAFAALLASLVLSGCGGGGAEENVGGSTATGGSAPTIPTSLVATAVSSSQINLSWNASLTAVAISGATGSAVAGYDVYRDGTQIASLGPVTTFQNTGLTPSTDYTYTVEAVNGNGKRSGRSNGAKARTLPAPDTTPPSTPTGITATAASSSQINLSWTAAADNVGVTGYNIYRAGMLIATLGAVTTFQNTGLTAFTTYFYTVEAFDAAGNVSAPSISASATTQAISDTTAPSIPAGLTATSLSTSQINLSWTAATDNVGVTGYNVYRGGALIATLGAVTAFQNSGLTASTTYSYTVRALDAAGNLSLPSSSASATTQAVATDTTPPSTPTGLSATVVSSSQVNLSWIAATDNVGVTGYNVYRGGALIATLGAVTTFQNTSLAASTTYSYTVRALDAAGNISAPSSSASATTQAVPDTAAPSTPIGLSATAISSSQINLSWTAATDNVGVAGYNVFRGGVQIATLGAVTTYQNTGLTASTTYSYTVQAFDAAGNVSGQSIAANATTRAPNPTAALAWDAVTTTNLSGYRVYYGTAPGTYLQAPGQGVSVGNVTTYTVTGLSIGTRYYFAVTAFDTSNNESGYSNEVFKDIQ